MNMAANRSRKEGLLGFLLQQLLLCKEREREKGDVVIKHRVRDIKLPYLYFVSKSSLGIFFTMAICLILSIINKFP